MKTLATFLSLILNLVLLIAIFFVLRKPAQEVAPRPTDEVSHIVVTQMVETAASSNAVPPPSPVPFDWSQVQAKDFFVYADNLRGINCPEETVCDILTAEVNQEYVRRRQDALRPLQSAFWDLMMARPGEKVMDKEMEKKLDALKEEKEALLKRLFRNIPDHDSDSGAGEYERLLADSLSPEKAQLLQDISKKFDSLRQDVQSSHLPDGEKKKQIAALNEQMDSEYKGILSPEELEEFKLRQSPFARGLQGLYGFEVDEEEARALAWLKLNETPADKPSTEQEIKSLLGGNRFDDYQRSIDPTYRPLYQLARRYELSLESVQTVHELSKRAGEQAEELRILPNVSDEERELMLEELQLKTRQAVIANLGERAAETYRRNGGEWMDNMGDP